MNIKKIITILMVLVFLGIMAFFMYSELKDDSPTTDETIHILSGYEYWQKTFSVNPEHPPLGKQIAALPLLFIKPVMPQDQSYNLAINDFYYDSWQETRAYSQNWLFKTDNNADIIVNSARTMVLIFTLIFGLILFFVAKFWYNTKTALIALFFFCFSPLFLAHGHLANTDLWATLGFFIAIFSFTYYLKKPDIWRMILAAICFAIAILFKFSMIILVPILVILWLIYRYKSNDRVIYSTRNFFLILISYFLVTLFLVWADYGFPINFATIFDVINNHEYTNKVLINLSGILAHLPVPQFFKGLIMVLTTSVSERPAYLLGNVSSGGWWYYFPIAYLAKEPLPLLILLIIAIIFYLFFRKRKLEFKDWILIIPPVVYVFITLFSKLNIGIRHIMPIYPFIFIFIGYSISQILNKTKRYLIAYSLSLIALLIWYFFAPLSVFPYFITYFNELAGGPQKGVNILADSNIDWGQDLKRLGAWFKHNNINEKVKLEYFWTGLDAPTYYGIDYQSLEKNNPNQTGWIAIGTTALQSKDFSWLKKYQPITIIGNGVYVYNIK
ncbi:MAG: glycosyltransferase family 39 protein [Patescibacteria group bacterium]|nr:glycosyltransferase family 39 protein [Patescibacteria group bacterium]